MNYTQLRPWKNKGDDVVDGTEARSVLQPINQVAGHGSADAGQAILLGDNGLLLKPLPRSSRGERELKFYREVWEASPESRRTDASALDAHSMIDLDSTINGRKSTNDDILGNVDGSKSHDEKRPFASLHTTTDSNQTSSQTSFTNIDSTKSMLEGFQNFIPRFHGVYTLESSQLKPMNKDSGDRFLVIENLVLGLSKPCIMDVKIGAITYGPDATPEKIAKQDSTYVGTRKQFGFSVSGMSVFSGRERNNLLHFDKVYGQSLNEDNLKDFLNRYLDVKNNPSEAMQLVLLFLEELEKLSDFLSDQKERHIFGSSLLFIYDAGRLQVETTKVKMIDFAHVWPSGGTKDDNYLQGLASLLGLFSDFRENL